MRQSRVGATACGRTGQSSVRSVMGAAESALPLTAAELSGSELLPSSVPPLPQPVLLLLRAVGQ